MGSTKSRVRAERIQSIHTRCARARVLSSAKRANSNVLENYGFWLSSSSFSFSVSVSVADATLGGGRQTTVGASVV